MGRGLEQLANTRLLLHIDPSVLTPPHGQSQEDELLEGSTTTSLSGVRSPLVEVSRVFDLALYNGRQVG